MNNLSVNIADIADLLSQEVKQAKQYEALIQQAENEEFKNKLSILKESSVKSVNLLTVIIKEGPWGDWK